MDAKRKYLEELMDLKRSGAVRFRPVDGGIMEARGHIVRMVHVSGRLIIKTNADLTIGEDQIFDINGRCFANIC